MKNIRNLVALAALLLAPIAAHASETYGIDPSHTSVTWTISHFGFSHPWGKFTMIEGSVVLDEQSPQKSSVEVIIPMADLFTGIYKLDEHLKSQAFFDVDTFPTATFTSTRVLVSDKDKTKARVEGNLTMHGVTHPEVLDVTLNKIGMNMMNKKTAGFSATATLKRSDFGMTTYLPGLGDEVKLYIESEANL